ncbi:MAG: MarR family transcriptional regulator, partial [Arachnia sp.]
MRRDRVSVIQDQWRRERPDVDVDPQAIIARLHRLAAALTRELVAVYDRHGLTEGDFDVLATLRRHGPAHALQPAELAR